MADNIPENSSVPGAEVGGGKPRGEDDIFNLLSTDLGGEEKKGEGKKDKGGEEKEEPEEEAKKGGDDFSETEGEDDEEDEDFSLDEDEEDNERVQKGKGKEDEDFNEEVGEVYYRELKKHYPDIFKKVPALKAVIGQHRGYKEIFPTVQDAREVNHKSEVFDFLDNRINDGDSAPLFNALHANDKRNGTNVLTKVAENLLPTLYEASPAAFKAATQPLLVSMLTRAKQQAASTGNKNLGIAADIIAENFFGTKQLPSISSNRPDPALEAKRQELENREQSIAQREHERHAGELATRADKVMIRAIEKRIDPEGVLSSFDREAKVNQVISELERTLTNDPNHMRTMENMRRRLLKAGYSEEEKARWVSTYLASAKSAIGPILRRAGAVKKSEEPERRARNDGRKVIPSSSKSGPTFRAGKLPPVAEMRKKGVSVLDVLNATAGDS